MREGLSGTGIDHLIILAEAAELADNEQFTRMMLASQSLAQDFDARLGERVSWGFKYLQDTRDEALAAIRDFPSLDPHDSGAVLACQLKVRDYVRVAQFVDRLLRETAQVVTGPDADDADDSDDGRGPVDA